MPWKTRSLAIVVTSVPSVVYLQRRPAGNKEKDPNGPTRP
jgi:hypothetical protein